MDEKLTFQINALIEAACATVREEAHRAGYSDGLRDGREDTQRRVDAAVNRNARQMLRSMTLRRGAC